MQRRNFLRNSGLTLLGTNLLQPVTGFAQSNKKNGPLKQQAKNIIFMVSDGMSSGTLTMANILLERKYGRQSTWMKLYHENKVARALMDTASASSIVTDSAAASSAWGGGVRVKNGALNVDMKGVFHKPILQKFKAAGKSVGCVTTVPITHATPAGFCINNNTRGDQSEIALQYLPLKFDVMMGGGSEFFSAGKRKDKQDVFVLFEQNGYTVVRDRQDMLSLDINSNKPVLGVFYENGLPFTLDMEQDKQLQQAVPTLAEMTRTAISKLNKNKNGFVMQVEGGKVDWAAHSNDSPAILYDQVAFDDAIKVAIEFAEQDKNTLVIITTDHGNSNPGFYGENAEFDKVQNIKHTNEWILKSINKNFTEQQVIDLVESAQGIVFKREEAAQIMKHYTAMDGDGLYNPYKLPFELLAQLQKPYTTIGWGAMDHSADHVELCMYGPGKELLNDFVKNYELHNLMLQAAGMEVKKA
ncbi:alkaline phosphatase [Ferruginibacter sp.]